MAMSSEVDLLSPREISLDEKQMENLSVFIKECKVAKMDLSDIKVAYNRCSEKDGLGLAFWQTPWGLVSIGLGSIAAGIIIGSGL